MKPANKTYTKKFITIEIVRHADFGGGTINADMPDTPNNRVSGLRLVCCWEQCFDFSGSVIHSTKPAWIS